MWTVASARQPVCLLTKSKNQAHLAAPKPCWSIGLQGFFMPPFPVFRLSPQLPWILTMIWHLIKQE